MKIYFFLMLACVCCYADGSAMHDVGITGGEPVNIVDAPWMARVKAAKSDALWCGAAIVHKKFVVTSLTCLMTLYYKDSDLETTKLEELATSGVGDKDSLGVVDLARKHMRVVVGTDHTSGEGKVYNVWRFFFTPLYKIGRIPPDWDIPVVQIATKFELNNRVKPISLAHKIPHPGAIVETLGFGNTGNGKPSNHLLGVKLPFVSQKTCNNILLKSNHTLTDRMVCAGGKKGASIAKGDLGGPLVFEGKLIGIASWVGTGKDGCPIVFASVPKVADFIDDIINM